MKIIKILIFSLVILLGIFFVIFGGYDDSPGLQGIGLMVAVFGIIKLTKTIKTVSK